MSLGIGFFLIIRVGFPEDRISEDPVCLVQAVVGGVDAYLIVQRQDAVPDVIIGCAHIIVGVKIAVIAIDAGFACYEVVIQHGGFPDIVLVIGQVQLLRAGFFVGIVRDNVRKAFLIKGDVEGEIHGRGNLGQFGVAVLGQGGSDDHDAHQHRKGKGQQFLHFFISPFLFL